MSTPQTEANKDGASSGLALATCSAFRRIGWREAERLLGGRVDRRKAFYFCDDPQMMEFLCGGPVFEYGEWTTSCSGCFETEDGHPVGEYPWDAKAHCHVGGGCSECGYTGKRRDGWHSPAQLLQNARGEPHGQPEEL